MVKFTLQSCTGQILVQIVKFTGWNGGIYTIELYWSDTAQNGQIYTVELYWSSPCPNGQIYGLNSGRNGEIYTVELYWSSTGQMVKFTGQLLVKIVEFIL